MKNSTVRPNDEPGKPGDDRAAVGRAMLDELRAHTARLDALTAMFDEFFRAYLRAKFPHGKATDRWAR